MELKNINEFIGESYTIDYLSVIINKMMAEGKSASTIFTYLDLLNIPKERILEAMSKCGCSMHESNVNEADLEDLIDDVDAEADDEKDAAEEEPTEEEPAEDEEKGKEEEPTDDEDGESELDKTIDNVKKLAQGMKAVAAIVKGGSDKKDEEPAEEEI